jgi:hypothetical protein
MIHGDSILLIVSNYLSGKMRPSEKKPVKLQNFLFCLLVIYILTAQTVCAGSLLTAKDIDFELFINDRFDFFNDFFNSGKKKFNLDRSLHILYVNPSLSIRLAPHVQAVVELESEFNIDLVRHNSDNDLDVRNAYIQTILPSLDWISFSAGRQALSTVNGLIYDDEATALRVDADIERGLEWPLKFQILGAEIENDSPYVHAELKYIYSFLESLTLYYGWFRDTKNGVARIFNYLEDNKIYKSRGSMQWYAFSLRKFFGDFLFRTLFIYERGSVSLRQKRRGTHSMPMRGYLLDFNCDYKFTDDLSASFFLFVSSGDRNPKKGTFRSFISINPYIDKTNIFFNGGIDGQFSADNVGLNGMQLPGVISPGLNFDYKAGKNTYLKFIFAYLLTHKGTGGYGRTYGWEMDFMGFYNINENLQLFGEFNLFDPGNYFKELTNHRDNISTEIIIGINYFFSN